MRPLRLVWRVVLFPCLLLTAAAAVASGPSSGEPALREPGLRQPVGASESGPTLDMRLASEPDPRLHPDAMCATSAAHAEWDRALRLHDEPRLLAPATTSSAAPPLPRTWIDSGVIVIEDNGSVLARDRRFDLLGTSLRFTPAGDGFDLSSEPLAYDPDIGTLVVDDVRSFTSYEHPLANFAFPFGGASYDRLWLATNLMISFAQPSEPGPAQWIEGDLLLDRTPRIGPLAMGRSLRGYSIYLREDADRLVVTWRTGQTDIQTVLLASGEILMSYQAFPVTYGAPVVISGNDAWWADLRLLAAGSDPEDVALGFAEDAGLDVLALEARQLGSSEIFEYALEFLGDVPASANTVVYEVVLRPTPDVDPVHTLSLWMSNGNVDWTNATTVEVDANRLSLRALFQNMNVPEDGWHVSVNTWLNDGEWHYADYAELGSLELQSPPVATMIDFSQDLPLRSEAPLYEAFTLPELRPYEVERVVRANFGELGLDGLPIYQNFHTDIVFYAGAYSTVGNAGADGIGVGSAADPIAPALLHMNTIREGWSASRQGASLVLSHEFGHHWLYFAPIDEGGETTRSLHPESAHYAGWVHTPAAQTLFFPDDSSCMGGSYWTDNGDGSFTASPALSNHSFGWADLYLMGLADPGETADFWYIANPDPSPPASYWPPNGMQVDSGTRTDVAVSQIITANGPRNPAWPNTQRDFRAPFVLVVRPGEWSPDDITETATLCQNWTGDFELITLNRATIDCVAAFNQAPDGVILTPSGDVAIQQGEGVSFSGDWSDPDGDDVTWLWSFDGAAPDSTDQDPGTVMFPDPGVYRVCLTVTDLPGLPDPEPPCVVVTVGCTPPASVGNTLKLVKDDAQTARAHWSDAPTATDHVLLSAASAQGPYATEVAVGTGGATGVPFAIESTPTLVPYRLAGRRGPDCVGEVD